MPEALDNGVLAHRESENEDVRTKGRKEGEGLRSERPVRHLLGKSRVPRKKRRGAKVAVLPNHVCLSVVLVVPVSPPRGRPSLQEALKKVLESKRPLAPPLSVASHVLQEAALRPASAHRDTSDHRSVRCARDRRDDRKHNADAIDSRGDWARLEEATLAPRGHQTGHFGDVLVVLGGNIGLIDNFLGQRVEHLPCALVVAMELLKCTGGVHPQKEV
mmetsp:Transcript_20611/g.62876  ORF Transcript_20611/g.62876 Transcript_20611/m.62876 type:complete len:217 (+) Transcript_20611:1046-1696(+)